MTRQEEYRRNPRKWQACSHAILINVHPEDLFDLTFALDYKRRIGTIADHVTQLHGTLYTLDTLQSFPFGDVYGGILPEFWRLVIYNFLDAACLILHGLIGDSGKEINNIPSLKTQLFKANWRSPEKKSLFVETWKERKFDASTDILLKKLAPIRLQIAHSLIEQSHIDDMTLKEMWELFDAVHDRFGALCIGPGLGTLMGDYIPGKIGGRPTPTSIDEILFAILFRRHFETSPDFDSVHWQIAAKNKDAHKLKVMAELRQTLNHHSR